jgi:hypothetical protein
MSLMTPEDVIEEFADRGVQLNVRNLENDAVLVEADRESLEFLARLLLALARSDDCGFQIGPSGAGASLFTESATRGLYLHRVPCEHRGA